MTLPAEALDVGFSRLTADDELVVARCDLDWCKRYTGTLFDFDRYRRPEVYTRISSQRGAILR